MGSEVSKTRESSYELIRIIAQYMIVLYHILLVIVYPHTGLAFFKAIWLPLHIGVPLFVLISGYFGIKANLKRIINYLGLVFVLQVPLLFVDSSMGGVNYLKMVFFLSDTPFWFIRTYFFLFLFSPVLNYYLKNISNYKRLVLLLILFFLSHYEGTLAFDSSLKEGYCLTTFMFFYVVGDTLRAYREKWIIIPRSTLWYVFLVYNVVLVVLFTKFGSLRGASFIYERLFFSYQSIGLLFSSIVFFMIIGGLNFHSGLVNRIGKSSLAIYMLHGSNICINVLLPIVVIWFCSFVGQNPVLIMVGMLVLASFIVLLCWLVYEMLMPIWDIIGKIGDICQKRYDAFKKEYQDRL